MRPILKMSIGGVVLLGTMGALTMWCSLDVEQQDARGRSGLQFAEVEARAMRISYNFDRQLESKWNDSRVASKSFDDGAIDFHPPMSLLRTEISAPSQEDSVVLPQVEMAVASNSEWLFSLADDRTLVSRSSKRTVEQRSVAFDLKQVIAELIPADAKATYYVLDHRGALHYSSDPSINSESALRRPLVQEFIRSPLQRLQKDFPGESNDLISGSFHPIVGTNLELFVEQTLPAMSEGLSQLMTRLWLSLFLVATLSFWLGRESRGRLLSAINQPKSDPEGDLCDAA